MITGTGDQWPPDQKSAIARTRQAIFVTLVQDWTGLDFDGKWHQTIVRPITANCPPKSLVMSIRIKKKAASSAHNPPAGIKPGSASADPAITAPKGGAKKLASAPSEPPLKPAKRRRERKTERIDLRLTPSAKEFIEHVVDVSGVSASNLLVLGAQGMLHDLQTRLESDRLDPTMMRFRSRR